MASTEQPDPPTQPGLPPGDNVAAPPREALITTAVKFLQNPKVRQSPLATRKAFLKKKGLTDEEVELAIQRSGSTEEVLPLSPVGPPHPLHATQLAPVAHSPAGYRWRDYGALTIIMVGIAFGFHHLTISQLQQTLVPGPRASGPAAAENPELSQELAAAERHPPSDGSQDPPGKFPQLLQHPPHHPLTTPTAAATFLSVRVRQPPVKDGTPTAPWDALEGLMEPQGITEAAIMGLSTTLPLDLKDQVRMEVQGEEERKEEEEDDVSHVEEEEEEEEEEEGLSMQTEDRRGGDGQINEQVDKPRRPESC
ncbi:peroxisomal membrane protein PEX14 isoform X1 [Lates japonicus]|uniref:Peroxisomal membrane protein PEX14 n=1 Tax=Lates japonicus TaxID=270547 RepID=A0AAD3M234_LATJO|nr:peroxisomal membrane protein PEX14 isoform X1 [Lates japonicus]